MQTRIVPKFATEAEEAQWWYDNREAFAEDWVNAGKEGRLGPGSAARLRDRLAAAKAEQEQAEPASLETGSFEPAPLKRAS